MSDDRIELFPEPPRDDRDDPPTEEELRGMAELLEELDLEESADGIETELRDAAAVFAFDLLLTLINPTAEERAKMVNGLISMVAHKIEGDVNERVDHADKEEVAAIGAHINKAFEMAEKRFRDDFQEGRFDESFLERCRLAVRKNLSR